MTLFAVSGIIPLLIPRQYIPVDPKVSFVELLHAHIADMLPEPNASDQCRTNLLAFVARALLLPGSHYFPRIPSPPPQVRPAAAFMRLRSRGESQSEGLAGMIDDINVTTSR
jgi:hypothetical protein